MLLLLLVYIINLQATECDSKTTQLQELTRVACSNFDACMSHISTKLVSYTVCWGFQLLLRLGSVCVCVSVATFFATVHNRMSNK